jgi:cytochrome P450
VGKEQLVLAFGEGLRACPGRNLALFEARAILSHLLENFEVTLSPGQTPSQSKVQGYVSLPLPSPKLLVKPRE